MASAIIGVVGIVATGVGVFYLQAKKPECKPQQYWLLGIAGLFPAWLVAFLSLLPSATAPGADTPLPPRALFSSVAGLLGVIATDYLLRRLQRAGRELRPINYWLIGWAGLLPACLIAWVSL
jgi:hypothetical protein